MFNTAPCFKIPKKLKLILLFVVIIFSCNKHIRDKVKKTTDLSITDIQLVYDTTALRIPGEKFRFGIKVKTAKGYEYSTKGWLGGTLRWANFKIRIDGGNRRFDKIIIDKDLPYSVKNLSIRVKGSKRLGLDTTFYVNLNQIVKMDLVPLNSIVKAPGRYIDFGLNFLYDCGINVLHTKKRKCLKMFENFDILLDGGTFYGNRFRITEDIFDIIEHQVGLVAIFKHDQSIRDTFEVQLDYRDVFTKYYVGDAGYGGFNGYNGEDGWDATCVGCCGGDAGHGESGGDGEPGFKGPDIHVVAEAYYDNILGYDLLKVRIDNLTNSFSEFLLVNPNGGKVNVTSEGGRGGMGGNGGNGGNGGSGGEGERYTIEIEKYVTEKDTSGEEVKKLVVVTEYKYKNGGNGGDGGNGGRGGDGGVGGRGGTIELYYTMPTKKYLNVIDIQSIAGGSGFGGYGGTKGEGGSGGYGDPLGDDGNDGYTGSTGNTGWRGTSANKCIYRSVSTPAW
jgi:hypothetical protein